MSNIPLARRLLLKLAEELDDPYSVRVRNIVEAMMMRQPSKRRADKDGKA